MPMVNTIVVPLVGPIVDPEKVSEQAIPVARALAQRTGGLVVLVSVMAFMDEFADLPESAVDDPAVIARRTDARRSYLREIGEVFEAATVHTEVMQGDAADGILALLKTLDNPVVVMSSHGRRGMRRMVLGSVAFDVVQRAHCPVVIVPARDADDEVPTGGALNRLMIPLDRSPNAEHAVDVAVAAMGSQPLEIHLVQVIQPLAQRSSRHAARYYATAKEVALEYLDGIAKSLTARGHDVTMSVAVGTTEEELTRESDEFGADLIVMATRGRSGVSRFLFGSVAEGLVQIGTSPILVVPPAAAALLPQSGYDSEVETTGERPSQLVMRLAREIMVSPAITVSVDATLEDVANVMLDNRVGCVPVVDDAGVLQGVITQSDFAGEERCPPFSMYRMPQLFGEWVPRAGIERIYEAGRTLRARQIMSTPVVTAREDEPVASIVGKLVRHDITSIPIVQDNVVVGIVTRHDLLKMLATESDQAITTAPDADA